MANEGEMSVETENGLLYSLRFGEIAPATGESSLPTRRGEPPSVRHRAF